MTSILWEFVRELKTDRAFAALDASQAAAEVEQVFASASTTWAELFSCLTDEDAIVKFHQIWELVLFPAGYGPIEDALKSADASPVELLRHRTLGYRRFISLCFWLQGLRGDGSIFLPVRAISDALCVHIETVSQYRRWAEGDGLLRVVSPHDFSARKATRFRFATERFNEMRRQTR